MVDLKSIWSPKLAGRELVTKNCALSGTAWKLFNFLLALQLYSLIKPKLFLSSIYFINQYLRFVNVDIDESFCEII